MNVRLVNNIITAEELTKTVHIFIFESIQQRMSKLSM